jgi:hypothetical protein
MNETSKSNWLNLWNQLFPENRLYDQPAVDEWNAALDHMEPAASNDEIRAALTALSEQKDIPKKGFGLRHVIARVNATRDTWKSLGSCGICRKGWLDYFHELPEEGFTLFESMEVHVTAIPCACKAGDAIQQKEGLTQDQIQRFRPSQRKADRQNRWLKKLANEAVPDPTPTHRDIGEDDEL